MRNRKAVATNNGSNQLKFLHGHQTVSAFNFKQNKAFGQCVKCGSDYLKYAVNGYCQKCLQRIEFIIREYPHILQNARNTGESVR